jgi:exodeoxyribonuclease VII large subunit
LGPVSARLKQSMEKLVVQRQQRLEQGAKLLDTLGYRQVLARGYALVQDADGELVTSAAEVRPGDPLHLVLADGTAEVTASGAPQRRKPGRASVASERQESLF